MTTIIPGLGGERYTPYDERKGNESIVSAPYLHGYKTDARCSTISGEGILHCGY